MASEDRVERWGWSTSSHSHYSSDVQSALKNYFCLLADYEAYKKINPHENMHRMAKVQSAFDELIKLRRKETGVGYYLNQEEYGSVQK
jgi:hypothetical protein